MKQPISHPASRLFGVVELGSSSVRCTIAEIRDGQADILEELALHCRLGEDMFRDGQFTVSSMDEAVSACRRFRDAISLYHVERFRAVVSSSIWAALNCDVLLERIRFETGMTFDVVHTQEEARLMLAALRERLPASSQEGLSLAVDLTGGNVELLLLEQGHLSFASSINFGTLRLQVLFEAITSKKRRQETLLQYLDTSVRTALRDLGAGRVDRLLLMGRDAQALVHRILPDSLESWMATITRQDLEAFCAGLGGSSARDKEFRRDLKARGADPELVLYAALFYRALLAALDLSEALVHSVTLRDGLLAEEIHPGDPWSDPLFIQSILHCARRIGGKFQVDAEHVRHVRELCLRLFDELGTLHHLGGRERVLLEVAAELFEIGHFVNPRSHHKHSAYLIEASEIPGLSRQDLHLVALIARYHRRTGPRPSHAAFMALRQEDRVLVRKLTSILRVADALAADHAHPIHIRRIRLADDKLHIHCRGKHTLLLETLAMGTKDRMFTETFGIRIHLVADHA